MNEEYAFITEPGENKVLELITVDELKDYQEKFNTGFHLTDKEAEVMLGYMEGHDYVLGENQGKLYRGDLAEVVGMICWEDFSMDDVIDLVCEWNYVIFSVNFINYCLNELIIEEGYNEHRATTH